MGYKLKLPHTIHQLFFWAHLLSLDVALGACLLGNAFVLIFPIEIPWHVYVLLFLSCLVVYWTDHLIDSANDKVVAHSMRHLFFKQHFSLFFILIILLICLNTLLAFAYLHWLSIIQASLFVGLIGVYLFFHRKFPKVLFFEKEVWVGFIYGFAIGLVPTIVLGMYSFLVWHQIMLMSLILSIVTIQNTFSIAMIESRQDEAVGIRNLCTRYSHQKLFELQLMFLILQAVLSIAFLLIVSLNKGLWLMIPLLLNSILQLLLPRYAALVEDESYRYLGEWLFIACGLLWLIL
jgi:hypothetical protein